MQDQQAQLSWRDGIIPISTRFDDPYFNLENGLNETRHVFLAGNDLPMRFRDGFHIAELGFGTGLNFLAAVQSWQASGCPGTLFYTSFEAFPMAAKDMQHALDAFAELAGLSNQLVPRWRVTGGEIEVFKGVVLNVIMGDARVTLPDWTDRADAWFLDGFSPAKNPELWGADLMAEVARHTKTAGTAATYTAAGFVRRGLHEAGFEVERVSGYGRKRHMTRAVLSA